MDTKIQRIEPPATVPGVELSPPRAARLPRFIGGPQSAASLLGALRIAIVGVGSIGSAMALHLSRLQVSDLFLIDPSRIKRESLLTHPVRPGDVSKPKASTIGRICRAISPRTEVRALDGPVESLGLSDLERIDAVVLATDNLLAEIETGQRCLWLGLPLLQASVSGEFLVCQVRDLPGAPPGADAAERPCPACGYSPTEWNALNRQTRFRCQGPDTGTPATRIEETPTMSVSFLCSLAADLAMTRLVRRILGLGAMEKGGDGTDGNVLVEYCGYTHRSVVSPLRRNRDCACDHTTLRRVPSPEPLPRMTLRRLAALASVPLAKGLEGWSFRVEGMVFSERAACGCPGERTLLRFLTREGIGPCRRCGQWIRPLPHFTHDPVPATMLADVFDRPLREIGAALARGIVVRGPAGGVLIGGGAAGGGSHATP